MLVVHLIIITYIVLSEDVFGQGMVVLLNPVCVLLSGMLHVYMSKLKT